MAGATSGTVALNIGNVDTTGGTGGNGNISLLTQHSTQQTITGASTMTILNGAITNSTTYAGGTTNAAS